MSEYCVVVADAARARFFTLEPAQDPETESGPRLREHKVLVNPEREAHGRDVFRDTRSGSNRAGGGGPAHGYDDHREQHEQEFERRFARLVAAEAESLSHACGASRLILAAPPRMLGFLRRDVEALARGGMQIREAASNLTKLAPHDIQSHLAKDRLLPACRRPGA